MANANMNYTYAQEIAPEIKDYYDRKLLDNIVRDSIHLKDLDQTILPKGQSGTIEFRRAMPLPVSQQPLVEGVTPDGQKIAIEKLTATIVSYGNYIEMTDEMNWRTLDNVHKVSAGLLSEQAKNTLDAIAKDKLHAGLNVHYVGANTKRATIKTNDKLTYDELRKVARTLKINYAKRFEDGYYHAICDEYTAYDLMSDPMFVDIAKYQDKSKVEKGELGVLAGIKFFTTPEGKIFRNETELYAGIAELEIENYIEKDKAIYLTAGATAKLKPEVCRVLAGKLVDIKDNAGVKSTLTIDRANMDGKIELRYIPSDAVTAKWKTGGTATPAIVPTGGGASGANVHSTLVFGKGYASQVSLESGGGKPTTIIKPLGSSGTNDPLDQRQTIAWKVAGFTVAILQDLFVVRVEHGATGN